MTVLAFNRTDEYAVASLAMTRSYCHAVYAYDNLDSEDARLKRKRQLRSLASRFSYEHNLGRRRVDFQSKLDALLEETAFDVIQVEFCTLAGFDFAKRKAGTRLVLDEHNIEYDLLRRSALAASGMRKVYNEVNWRKLRREELGAWRRFDGVVLTSERDQRLLHEHRPEARTCVVPNAANVDEFRPAERAPIAKRILFFGVLGYYPNEDGIEFFVDQVLPLILRRHPDAELVLVGPGAKEPVERRVGASVKLAGFVDDVQAAIDDAAVVIVPLRVGGGTRLKIVEAMAKGKAIVSTSLGAEGIELEHGRHGLIADDAESFASAVCRLFEDEALALRLGTAARQQAVAKYSWTAAALRLEAFYRELGAGEERSH